METNKDYLEENVDEDEGLLSRMERSAEPVKTIWFEAVQVVKDSLSFIRERPEVSVPLASVAMSIGAIASRAMIGHRHA